MKRLTTEQDWSPDYAVENVAQRIEDVRSFYTKNKNIRELWDSALLPHLRGHYAQSAVEIGSAPGQNLVELSQALGVTPFGVEYTQEGAELNRRLFSYYGLSPDNVVKEDFFSPALDSRLGKFDISLSFGFVEHFDDPIPVIRRQIEFCRIGGYAAIVIPNLRGVYYYWNKLFNPRVIDIHNIAMMRNESFFKMCGEIENFETVYSGYVGAFDYGLLTHRGQFLARAGIFLLRRLEPVTRFLDRHLLSRFGAGHPPYAVLIGKRLS